jgi:hypothetical protein
MRSLWRPFILFLSASVATLVAHSMESPRIGFVNCVSGDVVISPAASPDKKVTLKSGKSIMYPLHDGDTLECQPSSSATITISGQVKVLTNKDGAVALHPSRLLNEDEKRASVAIEKFGYPGGSRTIGSLVWWPADDGAVRSSENFHVRWNPPASAEAFTITVATEAGEPIWSVHGVASRQASLAAEQDMAIQRLLMQRQKDNEAQTFLLTVTSELQGSVHSTFSILSPREEARIDKELRYWDDNASSPLLRLVGRSDIFRSAHLYCDLADEYDAFLKLAPESDVLLREALATNQRIGNLARIHELKVRLHAASSEDANPE